MKAYQREFIEFALQRHVLRFGEFILKSNRKSPYFFNSGLFNTGKDLALLGQFYAAAIADANMNYDIIFGPAYKGIPIVSAATIALAEKHNIDIPYCFNRKEEKDHGEGGNLVGCPLQGNVLLVDDVITAGTAVHESMEIITKHKARLAGVVISLDRQEKARDSEHSAIQLIEQTYQCSVASIITLNNLIEYLADKPEMADNLASILHYREIYGIKPS